MRPLFLSALFFAACATPQATVAPEPVAPPAAPAPKPLFDATKPMPPGLDEAALNPTVDPCNDFYEYACGGWMQTSKIADDRPINSRSFVAIADRNEVFLRAILDEAAAGKLPEGTPFSKHLGDYYATCTDEAKLETSLPAVKKYVAKVTAVKSARDLAKAVGTLHADGVHVFFDGSAWQDLKKSDEVVLGLDQSGLGLPDRDYYTEQDDRKKAIREAYLTYVAKMFELYGEKPEAAKVQAQKVFDLETRLATKQQTKVQRRDPTSLYNRIELAGLKTQAKDFDWDGYLAALGGKGLTTINVSSVPYFQEVAAVAKDTKSDVWKAYLTWHVIRASVPALPKAFQDEAFAFVSTNLSGQKADRPRWKKCVAFSDGALGEALAREFTRRHFPEDSKARTEAMIAALQQSFETNLTTLKWMDDATRAEALKKVQRMVGNNKIGYPSKWRDYSSVTTSRDTFFGNSQAFSRFETKRQLAKVGKPVDRTEWYMSAHTVNAYYDPQKNEIVFPAGILQPPFFNKDATDAVNFGAMGMVVGHEITHGFDDEGRQFDVDGNLKDWWTEASGKNFVQRAQCVKDQYDGYVAIDDIKVKGDLTLGENVADLGGLKLAHAAMKDWYSKKGIQTGQFRFNEDQQIYLGMAQAWCTKMRPELARLRAATDPHSPPALRVKGPLGNLDGFKTAFQCADTSPMIRTGADRCTVW